MQWDEHKVVRRRVVGWDRNNAVHHQTSSTQNALLIRTRNRLYPNPLGVNVSEVLLHTIGVSESQLLFRHPLPVTLSHTHIRAGCAGRTPAKISCNINTRRVQAKRELLPNKILSRYKSNIHKFTNESKIYTEFPAQNGEHEKNVRSRSGSLDDRTHGCRILP